MKGLDEMDRQILTSIIDNYDGGPVGIDTLGVAISEDAKTLEEVYEPFLIKEGFIQRTPRGRIALEKTYKYLNKEFKKINNKNYCNYRKEFMLFSSVEKPPTVIRV